MNRLLVGYGRLSAAQVLMPELYAVRLAAIDLRDEAEYERLGCEMERVRATRILDGGHYERHGQSQGVVPRGDFEIDSQRLFCWTESAGVFARSLRGRIFRRV